MDINLLLSYSTSSVIETVDKFKNTDAETPFANLFPGAYIILDKINRNKEREIYIGRVTSIRKSGALVLSLSPFRYIFKDSEKKVNQSSEISFRNSSSIKTYIIDRDQIKSQREAVLEQRKAYAKARQLLKQGRTEQNEAFTLLHMDTSITAEEFRKRRRVIMAKFHPDRWLASGLSKEEFTYKSEKVTSALAFVENFIKSRDSRK